MRFHLLFPACLLLAISTFAAGSIDASLLHIFGEGQADKAYIGRIDEVHKLPRDLAPGEIDAIYGFLADKRVKDDVLSNLEFNAIKNELAIVLMHQKTPPEGFAANLVAMFSNKENDPTWRDYCIQFMGQWHPKESSPDARKAMAAAIREALKERSTSMAGTALIAMESLKGNPDGFSEDEIASAAYEMTMAGGEPESFQLNKATALQILSMLKDKRALQLAKDLLRDSKEIGIKASAICAIGMLGSKEDIPLIEKYVKGTETRLRMPAKQAIKKIEKREL